MPKIQIQTVPEKDGSSYPSVFGEACKARRFKRLGDAGGLTQFGVNLVTLPPGIWTSQRHTHSAEDEFVYILSGRCILVDENGSTELSAGDACAHPAGDGNAHHLQNPFDADCVFLVCGSRKDAEDYVEYPDIDMRFDPTVGASGAFTRKDGTPYE